MADMEAASRFTAAAIEANLRDDCGIAGEGRGIVYAYTFSSLLECAFHAGSAYYPVKIGCTTCDSDEDVRAAAHSRVWGQIVHPEPTTVLGLMRCQNARRVESRFHRQLKPYRIKTIGKEWFITSREEVLRAIDEYVSEDENV